MKRITFNITIKLIVISSVFISGHAFAQDNHTDSTKTKLFNNSIYAGFGISVIGFPGTIYYERILKQNMKYPKISSYLKVGAGSFAHWEGLSENILIQYGILKGTKKRRFEASIGLNYFYRGDLSYDYPLLPSGSIGYRFHNPVTHDVFRTGIGFPEGVYFNYGLSF